MILELPSANVSIVPEPELAEAIGVAEKVLNIIINASMTERVALACTGVRVRGIVSADNIRGLCRLRRGSRKKPDINGGCLATESAKISLLLVAPQRTIKLPSQRLK